MGTRGLYCAVVDGEFKVAQYGQWDAYPSGQGLDILKFVRAVVANGRVEEFKTALRGLKVLTDEEIKAFWEQQGADANGFIDMGAAKRAGELRPELSRDTGSDIMQLVLDGKAKAVKLSTDFASDSLFCEWAYVIDTDAGILEVFKGFQKEKHDKGRFATKIVEEAHRTDQYFPVAEVARFSFTDLPDNDTFLAKVDPPEEDEDESSDEPPVQVTEVAVPEPVQVALKEKVAKKRPPKKAPVKRKVAKKKVQKKTKAKKKAGRTKKSRK